MIALLGMMLLGVDFLYGVAISASIGVLLVMLASLTLLPALLTIAGARVARPGAAPAREPASPGRRLAASIPASGDAQTPAVRDARRPAAWLRWSRFVQRRPWTIAIVSTLVMLPIAAPAMALRLGSSDAGNDPPSQTTHRAYELLAQGFGEGFNGPLLVVARSRTPAHQAAKQGVVTVTPPTAAGPHRSKSCARDRRHAGRRLGRAGQAQPGRRRGHDHRLPPLLPAGLRDHPARLAPARQRDPAGRRRRPACSVYVGGVTAGAVDFADDARPQAAAVHRRRRAALSALLLMIVFRSLVIPLQAAFMNLLSIGAALGRDRHDLPVGLARTACSASSRARSSRSSP